MNVLEFTLTIATHFLDENGNKIALNPPHISEYGEGSYYTYDSVYGQKYGTYQLRIDRRNFIIKFNNDKEYVIDNDTNGILLYSTSKNPKIWKYDIAAQRESVVDNIDNKIKSFFWNL